MGGKKVIIRTLDIEADTTLTKVFMKMKIDELSVSPGYIFPVRKVIRETE